jgi:hypothetical protein
MGKAELKARAGGEEIESIVLCDDNDSERYSPNVNGQ